MANEKLREALEKLTALDCAEAYQNAPNWDSVRSSITCRIAKYAVLTEPRQAASGAQPPAEIVNELCAAISRIRWARGTDKLDTAINDAIAVQTKADAEGLSLAAPAPALSEEQVRELANTTTASIMKFLREYQAMSQKLSIAGHHAPALSGEIYERVLNALLRSGAGEESK